MMKAAVRRQNGPTLSELGAIIDNFLLNGSATWYKENMPDMFNLGRLYRMWFHEQDKRLIETVQNMAGPEKVEDAKVAPGERDIRKLEKSGQLCGIDTSNWDARWGRINAKKDADLQDMEQVFHDLNTLRKTRAIAGGTPDEEADGSWDSGEDEENFSD